VPEGWQVIRIGFPTSTEFWLDCDSRIAQDDNPALIAVSGEYYGEVVIPVAIVARRAHWQKLWPHQWREKPIQGRIRNQGDEPWQYGTIVQYKPGPTKWKRESGMWYQFAEFKGFGK